jgi:hypothetical protein
VVQHALKITMPLPGHDQCVCPLLSLEDCKVELSAQYPVAQTNWNGDWPGAVTSEVVVLEPGAFDAALPDVYVVQQMTVSTGDLSVVSDYYWPMQPLSAYNDYTAPLLKWEKTTVSGITSNAFDLRGYYSQTYYPGHHNQSEEFLFEPGLEPGLSAGTLQELRDADIKMIYIHFQMFGPPIVKFVGFDDVVRDYAPPGP